MKNATKNAGAEFLDEILNNGYLIGFTHETYLAQPFVKTTCDAVGLSVDEACIDRIVEVIREEKENIRRLINFKDSLQPHRQPRIEEDRKFQAQLKGIHTSIAERINQELLAVSHA